MHHQLNTLRVRIIIEHLDIEVRIRSYKIKDIQFLMTEPVFPSFVPTFNQYFLQTILCSKVNIALHFLIGSTMSTIRLTLAIISNTQTNRRKIIRITPCLGTYNHVPPYTTVLGRVDPGSILYLARFIEVQCQLARKHITRIITHENSTPRCIEWSLDKALATYSIRSQPRLKHEILLVEVEVHGRIIQTGSLMDIDIKTILRLQLKGSLHARIRENSSRRITLIFLTISSDDRTDTSQRSDVVLILLCIIITWNPVCSMITSHCKLSVLLLNHEVVQRFLLRKLVAQAHTVIIDTETDGNVTIGRSLIEVYLQLIVMIANGGSFTPDRFPSLIKSRSLATGLGKTIHQIRFFHPLRGMLILCQLQTEMGRLTDSLAFVTHLISRLTITCQGEGQRNIPVRRLDGLSCCKHREQQAHK